MLRSAICLLLLVGCADSYSVTVRFNDEARRANAERVEVVLVSQCPVELLAPPVDIFRRIVLRDGEAAESLGDFPSGAYGLYARAVDDTCRVIAAGCTPVLITSGESGDLVVTLSNIDGQECVATLCGSVCTNDAAVDSALNDAASNGPVDAGTDALDAAPDAQDGDAEANDAGPPCLFDNYPATINANSPDFYFRFEGGGAAEDDRGSTEAELRDDFTIEATSAFPALGNSLALGETGAFVLTTNQPDDSAFTLAVWVRVAADIRDQLPRAIFISEEFRATGFRLWVVEGLGVHYTTRFGHPADARIEPVVFGELVLNEWTHVVLTVDPDEVHGYLNGVEVVNTEVSNLNTGSLVAGSGSVNGLSAGIDIDELAYYPRVLDAALVLRHYRAAVSCPAP